MHTPKRPPTHQHQLPLLPQPTAPEAESSLDPQVDQLARQLIAFLIEVIDGRRRAQQLRGWVTEEVYQCARSLAAQPTGSRLRIRSIRLQMPRPRIIEASVHLTRTGRSQAAAIRLSFLDGRWQISHLETVRGSLHGPRDAARSGQPRP